MHINTVSGDGAGAGMDDSDKDGLFLGEEDIIEEIPIDEEDVPDRDDESDNEIDMEEADDSIFIFRGHSDEIYTVACSPIDASLVASGGKDDKGFLWTIGFNESALELPGHNETVSSVAFSYDGQFLASGSFDGNIQVWDTNSGLHKCTLEGSGHAFEWIRWHPRGNLILAGSEDTNVWLWNPVRNICLNTFSGHGNTVTCGDFTPDGKTICTGSDDESLRIWNPRTGECIHTVRGHPYHTDGLTCLSITSDSTLALTGSKDHSVQIVKTTSGLVASSLISHTDSVECIGISSSDPWAATGGMDGNLIIWDLRHSLPRATCNHEEGVTCLAWLGTSCVATGCVDGKVRIWDARSGDCARTFYGHQDIVQSVAVTADAKSIVSVSSDGTGRVFVI